MSQTGDERHAAAPKAGYNLAMSRQRSVDAALAELRTFGLKYPGAHLKSPWPGHLDLAVKDKTFAYLSAPGEPFSISCKLPRSNALALALPFTEPTAYALGRSGWVTARPPVGAPLPFDMFKAWIDESYRAQAPKKLAATLTPEAVQPSARRRAPAKAPAPSKQRASRGKAKAASNRRTSSAEGRERAPLKRAR